MKIITKSLMGVLLLGLNISGVAAQTEQSEGAQVAQQPLSQRLLTCRNIESALQRLDCFDHIARALDDDAAPEHASIPAAAQRDETRASVREQEQTPRRANAAEAAEAQRQQAHADDFGREHRADIEREESGRRHVDITEVWQNPRGLWRFRLADGAEWHQTQSERFHYDDDATYYIERGALNSFRLGREGSNRNIRIRRVD